MNAANNIKKKLSGLSIVSMICAIVFSIAAACMVFLPVISPDTSTELGKKAADELSAEIRTGNFFFLNRYQEKLTDVDLWGDGSTMDISVIGKTGSNYMKASSYISDNEDKLLSSDNIKKLNTMNLVEVITATAAFFGLIAVAVFVIIGKLLQSKKGGRTLALIFAIIGALIGIGYLVTTILYANAYNDCGDPAVKAVIGIGPILMAAFSVLTAVFCFFGLGNSAFKKTETVPAPNFGIGTGGPVPANINTPVQPAQPVMPPVQPVMPPVQPAQHVQSNVQVTPPVSYGQKAAIEGIKGEYKGAEIDLEPNEKLIIGRDPTSCNIVVSSENKDISRMHCSVWYDPEKDAFKVMDTSSNGTFVGGQRLPRDKKVQVPDNTIISLGGGENQFILRKK